MDYQPARLTLSKNQIGNLHRGNTIKLLKHQIGSGPHTILLHPVNHKMLSKAYKSGKGCCLQLSPGEIKATKDSTLEGSGLWDTIKGGLKWLGTQALDGIAQGTKEVLGDTPLGNRVVDTVRGGVKNLTGMGIAKKKKTPSKRKAMTGGSFLMPHQ